MEKFENQPDELNKTPGTWNWIFFHIFLRYFTLLEQSWFGQYIFWKRCTIETLPCKRLRCYLNSTAAPCKPPRIRWEFEEFTHWLGLVATCFGGFTYLFYNFMIMLIESKGTVIILWNPMLISGNTLFCISQKDNFNLHWHDIIDT